MFGWESLLEPLFFRDGRRGTFVPAEGVQNSPYRLSLYAGRVTGQTWSARGVILASPYTQLWVRGSVACNRVIAKEATTIRPLKASFDSVPGPTECLPFCLER